jgi:hypothetical protein
MMLVPGSIPRMILSLFLRGSVGESCTVFCYIYLYMLLKNPNRLGVALKVAIVFVAAIYIAWRLFGKNDIRFFPDKISYCISQHPFIFLSVIFLMPLNWWLESYKWKLMLRLELIFQ